MDDPVYATSKSEQNTAQAPAFEDESSYNLLVSIAKNVEKTSDLLKGGSMEDHGVDPIQQDNSQERKEGAEDKEDSDSNQTAHGSPTSAATSDMCQPQEITWENEIAADFERFQEESALREPSKNFAEKALFCIIAAKSNFSVTSLYPKIRKVTAQVLKELDHEAQWDFHIHKGEDMANGKIDVTNAAYLQIPNSRQYQKIMELGMETIELVEKNDKKLWKIIKFDALHEASKNINNYFSPKENETPKD